MTEKTRATLNEAAPDMLAALIDLIAELDREPLKIRKDFSKIVRIEAARKAIRKATGND